MNDKKLLLNNERRKRLIKSRAYLSLSQREMGAKCGMKGPDIKNREHGVVEIKQIFADALEKHLNISSAWLMNDQGEMIAGATATNDKMTNIVREALTPYVSPNKTSPSDSPPDIQDAVKYAITAFKILTSGTGYASALRENITWFDEAVDDKKRIIKLEDDMESLKEQLLASGTLSSK